MRKLKPCDCIDYATARLLNEQGIGHNDKNIMLRPNHVIITLGHTTVKIPMKTFKMFSEWFLEEQEIEDSNETPSKLYCNACGREKEEDLDHCPCYEGDEWVNKKEIKE